MSRCPVARKHTRCFWTWPFGHCWHNVRRPLPDTALPVPFMVSVTQCCKCGKERP